MIDFRYHLVSIASIFLALAVGIVLGAGPLKGTIGDTLASEVTKLRDDANTLRADLTAAENQISSREEVSAELRARTVADVLDGQTVSVLALPGASDSTIEQTQAVLTEAGAQIGTQVTLDSSWTSADPPEASDRAAAAASLRELMVADLSVGASPETVIGEALAMALLDTGASGSTDGSAGDGSQTDGGTDGATDGGTDGATDGGTDGATDGATDGTTGGSTGTATDGATLTATDGATGAATDAPEGPSLDGLASSGTERAGEILAILADNGLISILNDSGAQPGEAVLVIAPETDDVSAETVTAWGELTGLLEEAGSVVVAGQVATDASLETNLIATIRDNSDLSGAVSTLDNASSAMGQTAVPFTVYEQLSDVAGHYGTLGTASQLFPPVPNDTDGTETSTGDN